MVDSSLGDLTKYHSVSFTLVHGTVPRIWRFRIFGGRSWTDDGSAFRTALVDNFPCSAIRVFNWSGRNSHKGRLQAGEQLSHSISTAIAENPRQQHVIVAHSHGGNVALYAFKHLSDYEIKHIRGLVCVGTPFLWATGREPGGSRRDLWLSIFLGTGCAAALLRLAVAAGATLLSILLALACIAGIAGAYRLTRTAKQWGELTSDYEDKIRAITPGRIPIYAMSTRRDEALILLDFMSFFPAWLLSLRQRAIEVVSEFASNAWYLIKEQAEEVGEIVFVVSWFFALPMLAFVAILFFPLAGFLVASVYAGVGLLLLPHAIALLTLLTRSAPWGFGEYWLLPFLIRVEATRWPSGYTPLLTTTEESLAILALQHVALTQHPETLNQIWNWMRTVALNEEKTSSKSQSAGVGKL